MSEQRPIQDEIDELIVVEHEINREAEHAEVVRPLADRSVELAEDIYRREREQHKALEPGEG